MKTIFSLACIAATATCVLTSCDPQAFSMNIEMRYPSKSGIDLTGKSVAVVYLEDGAGKDTPKVFALISSLTNGRATSTSKRNTFKIRPIIAIR